MGLAYTLLVHATWAVLVNLGTLIPTPELVGLALSAVVWGVIIAKLHTHGWVYRVLHWFGVTFEPAWPTIWQTTFRDFRQSKGQYVVLHLKDRRRVYGGLCAVSSTQAGGHIYLEPSRWLDDPDSDLQNGGLMFNADDVAVVEFVPTPEPDDERSNDDSPSAASDPTG